MFDDRSETLRYAYRRNNPSHANNEGLRRAMRERVPLAYFHIIKPGWYVSAYPVFVIDDDRASSLFTLQADDLSAALAAADGRKVAEGQEDARRAYVTRSVRQRLHQVAFRERVIRAYRERCALCSLHHEELLDAAHITPDSEPEGEPVTSNGVALCKLHHAAFDRLFFTIRPDYVIEVRPSILTEHDGPMLVVGLQQIQGNRILLPQRVEDRPDQDRLQRRYEEFLRAG